MKHAFLFILPLILSACVGSVQSLDVSDTTSNTAYLIVDVDATFDGSKVEGEALATHCILGARHFDSLDGVKGLSPVAKDTNKFIIYKAEPGRHSFDGIGCMAYKVLWNKNRVKTINPPLIVDVQPGTITYPGTLVVDWESEGFGGLDLINGGGGLDEDDGKLAMKRSDRSEAIKTKLRIENPALIGKFKFVTTKFESNPRIVQ